MATQVVWPLNENGEIVFTAGTGSGNVTGYLSQDVLPSSDNASIPFRITGNISWQDKWDSVFEKPLDSDIPTVTSSTTSQITTPTVKTPTADFYYDPNFVYDGTYKEAVIAITGGVRVDSSNGQLCPEIYTDCQDLEFKFNPGRTGSGAVHLRVIVDGKWCQLKMLRFDSTSGTPNFYRLQFPTKKLDE